MRTDMRARNNVLSIANRKAMQADRDSIRDAATARRGQDQRSADNRYSDNVRLRGQDIASNTAMRRQDMDQDYRGALIQQRQLEAQASSAAERNKTRNDYYEGLFYEDRLDEDGRPTGEQVLNKRASAQAQRRAGGAELLNQLDASTAGLMLESGTNVNQILSNVNAKRKDMGLNTRIGTFPDLLKGAHLSPDGRMIENEVSLWDVMRSENINITDIFDRKVTLGDGMIMTVGDFFGDAALTGDEDSRTILRDR